MRKSEPSQNRKARPKRRRSFGRGGPTKVQRKKLRETLLRMHAALLRSNEDLASEALKKSGQDFSVDHMADHGSDNFVHHPLLSSQPGVFNPTETYAIVGPDTAANPFTPSISTPPSGSTAGFEGLRSQRP